MYETGHARAYRWRHGLASERRPAYQPAAGAGPRPQPAAAAGAHTPAPQPPVGLAAALDGLAGALDTLADVDPDGDADETLRQATVQAQALANRLAGLQLRLLERLHGRGAYHADGAVTAASWLRARTGQDHHSAARQVEAARRLRRLPGLRAALEAGDITYAHAAEVTRAAIPRRMDAIAACDDTLTDLARHAPPRQLRRALRAIRDHADPDGSQCPPLDDSGRDERRELDLHRSIDSLYTGRFTLDLADGEALATILDAYDQPDPPGTPPGQRRSAGQRRADALAAAIRRLLDHGHAPAVHGTKPHLLIMCDLHTLLGHDHAASFTPRLRHTGELDPDHARRLVERLAHGGDVKATAVLTLGPWRVTNVGRTQRTLPAWLRPALHAVHGHCRGPDCDRPATWTQAHHQHDWRNGADTDINTTIPLCIPHHNLITHHGWHATLDPDTGICTWTSPDGRTIHTKPRPP